MATFDLQVLLHDAGVRHFVIEVVAFTGALTHAGEHGQTAMRLGDVVDELHHVHGLADAGATEQTHLAALGERADQVDHLDAGLQQVLRRASARRRPGRRWMEAVCSGDRAALVDGVAQHVHDAAQGLLADRHRDGVAPVLLTSVPRRRPSDEPRAMVRTTPSPSAAGLPASGPSLPSSARRRPGIWSRGNSTSTTAPMH